MKTIRILTILTTLTLVALSRPGAEAASSKILLSSTPVAKDGLQVTVTLPQASFAIDEPLKFTVEFKNVSDKPLALDEVDWFWDWNILFEDVAGMGGFKGPWQLRLTALVERSPVPPRICQPGETVKVVVDLSKAAGKYDLVWRGEQEQPLAPAKQLHPGKYGLTVEPNLKNGPVAAAAPFWTAKIKTEPVGFAITAKP